MMRNATICYKDDFMFYELLEAVVRRTFDSGKTLVYACPSYLGLFINFCGEVHAALGLRHDCKLGSGRASRTDE